MTPSPAPPLSVPPSPRPALVPATVPACPRCHEELAVVHPQKPRADRIMALLCPSITCGYKLIVPR